MYPSKAYQRVMFVDDEEGVRLSWNRFLSERGFQVTTVEDGEGAISRLSEAPVDVVVSDLRMPGLDGLQLLQWVHERRPETRFILLTGYGNEEVERRARELGAYEYLNKPISPDALSAVVTAAMQLERSKAEKAVAAGAAAGAAGIAPVVEEAAQPAMPEEVGAREAEQPGRARSAGEVAAGLVLAPLLGLAFVMFLPVISIGALVWVTGQAIRKRITPARV